jgi:hypothetical protein
METIPTEDVKLQKNVLLQKFMLPRKISRWTTLRLKVCWTSLPAPVETPMSYPRLAEFTAAQKQKRSADRGSPIAVPAAVAARPP